MQLRTSNKPSLEDGIFEFDSWVTPSLTSLRDTDRYKTELSDIVEILEVIGEITANFKDHSNFNVGLISEYFLKKFSDEHQLEHLLKFAKVLFLVTGKSDNNLKCQFPVYLNNLKDFPGYPLVRSSVIQFKAVPRVLQYDDVMKTINKLSLDKTLQAKFLALYVDFIVGDTASKSQFWALGNSYFHLKPLGKHLDLLAPIVIFQIRGSATSSGGHVPENMLREQMASWGLLADIDFNSQDIIVSDLLNFLNPGVQLLKKDMNEKTRAYDFVLPFKTPGWSPRLFLQCQFYAGDSGSVSHKNVDQTRNSRNEVLKVVKNPHFIEFVDGAGYSSSLNGDLKKLLFYTDTNSFIQLRTAAIKLRRAFQEIGFLTPVEVEHAVILSGGDSKHVNDLLLSQKYHKDEIKRAITFCVQQKYVAMNKNVYSVSTTRLSLSRKYLLLDFVANFGADIKPESLNGNITVPGYGRFYGLSLNKLGSLITDQVKTSSSIWKSPSDILNDIHWLSSNGYIKNH